MHERSSAVSAVFCAPLLYCNTTVRVQLTGLGLVHTWFTSFKSLFVCTLHRVLPVINTTPIRLRSADDNHLCLKVIQTCLLKVEAIPMY